MHHMLCRHSTVVIPCNQRLLDRRHSTLDTRNSSVFVCLFLLVLLPICSQWMENYRVMQPICWCHLCCHWTSFGGKSWTQLLFPIVNTLNSLAGVGIVSSLVCYLSISEKKKLFFLFNPMNWKYFFILRWLCSSNSLYFIEDSVGGYTDCFRCDVEKGDFFPTNDPSSQNPRSSSFSQYWKMDFINSSRHSIEW